MTEYRSTREWPFHISCGGAVYRREGNHVLYAVLSRRPGRRGVEHETWHLPKGTLRSDETLEACALREVREESGLEAAVEAYLGSLHGRWMDTRRGRLIDKTTHYFLCRCDGAEPTPMDDEHDRLDWLPAEEAIRKLDLEPKQEAEIIRRAEAWLARSAPTHHGDPSLRSGQAPTRSPNGEGTEEDCPRNTRKDANSRT